MKLWGGIRPLWETEPERFDRRHWERLCAAALLLLGCGLRLAGLAALPRGLNQDEASAGYEALALLRGGIDRNGDAWPVLFTAWGSGQNVLMSYLALPLLALFGPGVVPLRLVNALSGCLTLPVFWRLARRCGGAGFGLTALLLLAVNPWHIMASRWALESNLLPFLLLAGIWLCVLAWERPWALIAAGAVFGLSLYAYGAAFFFLPPYLLLSAYAFRQLLRQRARRALAAAGVFALLAFPIALCQLRNALGLPAVKLLCFTLPRLTQGRQAAVSIFGGGSLGSNLLSALRLLLTQSDGLPWNSLPLRQGGIFYFFGLPTAVAGVIYSLRHRAERREEAAVRLALLSALLCACLIRVNINRINMLWLPLIYFSALGLHLLLRTLRPLAVPAVAVVLACAAIFFSAYAQSLGGAGNVNFFPGLGEAITWAAAQGESPVYVTGRVNQPYIFALYYAQVPPEDFAVGVVYRNPDAAFRQVLRFPGFEFAEPERAALLVLHRAELGEREALARFGDYAVVR